MVYIFEKAFDDVVLLDAGNRGGATKRSILPIRIERTSARDPLFVVRRHPVRYVVFENAPPPPLMLNGWSYDTERRNSNTDWP